jgi:DUF1365 family protein
MGLRPEHIVGRTFHGRHGPIRNRFSYGIDYVLVEPEAEESGPRLFSRNRANLTALHDVDHGGKRGAGKGANWVREVLAVQGLAHLVEDGGRILLLAQPRVLGHVFNPVAFWLIEDGEKRLRAVIAEVNNTFGDRHSYLCHRPDLGPITSEDWLTAQKIFHVSPFQKVRGIYSFRFDISDERIGITIDYRSGEEGVLATLSGRRQPLTNRSILRACLRRPFGSRRVLALIYWQAALLKALGAPYLSRPAPPKHEVSR